MGNGRCRGDGGPHCCTGAGRGLAEVSVDSFEVKALHHPRNDWFYDARVVCCKRDGIGVAAAELDCERPFCVTAGFRVLSSVGRQGAGTTAEDVYMFGPLDVVLRSICIFRCVHRGSHMYLIC